MKRWIWLVFALYLLAAWSCYDLRMELEAADGQIAALKLSLADAKKDAEDWKKLTYEWKAAAQDCMDLTRAKKR